MQNCCKILLQYSTCILVKECEGRTTLTAFTLQDQSTSLAFPKARGASLFLKGKNHSGK